MDDATTLLDRLKQAVSDFARPFAIYSAAASAAATPVIIVLRMKPEDLELGSGAIFVAAIFTGLAALYGARAAENANKAKHDAQVQIAAAQASQPAAAQ